MVPLSDRSHPFRLSLYCKGAWKEPCLWIDFLSFLRSGKAGYTLCPGQEGGHQDRQQGEAQRERSAKGTAVISKPKICYKRTVERNARIQSTVIFKPLRSAGIDSQPGGPLRQPYLTYGPPRLHKLTESIPGNPLSFENVYKFGLLSVLLYPLESIPLTFAYSGSDQ